MAVESKWKNRAPRYRRNPYATGMPRRGSYIWRVPPHRLHRTRPDHLRLNGLRFRWQEPPVVNRYTGRRAHPGMDLPCHCYAEPVGEDASTKRPPFPKNPPLRFMR